MRYKLDERRQTRGPWFKLTQDHVQLLDLKHCLSIARLKIASVPLRGNQNVTARFAIGGECHDQVVAQTLSSQTPVVTSQLWQGPVSTLAFREGVGSNGMGVHHDRCLPQ